MPIDEKDMEDQIAADPEKFLEELGLKLVASQYSLGSYRFDLLFEDRHGDKLLVEIQKGTLDRVHTYKILDYYYEYKGNNPKEFVDLMVVANRIPRERRQRLADLGIEYLEIPLSKFDIPSKKESKIEKSPKPSKIEVHDQHMNIEFSALNIFIINTDATSLGGTSPHNIWFETNLAFTGGDYSKYGEQILGKLKANDKLIMYANKIGGIGVGTVQEKWNGKSYTDNQLVYRKPYEDIEYRIKTTWNYNFLNDPIPASSLISSNNGRKLNAAFIEVKDIQSMINLLGSYGVTI